MKFILRVMIFDANTGNESWTNYELKNTDTVDTILRYANRALLHESGGTHDPTKSIESMSVEEVW